MSIGNRHDGPKTEFLKLFIWPSTYQNVLSYLLQVYRYAVTSLSAKEVLDQDLLDAIQLVFKAV